MATYPDDIASFRPKQNIPGQTFDADKKTTIYAEDVTNIEDEVVAIEETLGTNPQGEYDTVAERIDNLPSGGGGSGGFTDNFSVQIAAAESNALPSDDAVFDLALAQSDNVDLASDAAKLGFPAGVFDESSTVPTDAKAIRARFWLTGSAGTGVTNPGNANGTNNGTLAELQTVALGPITITMTSGLGVNIPTVAITSVVFIGWFRSNNLLATSRGSLILRSSSALFTDVVMFSNSALTTDIVHLSGDFTFDLLAAGINTLAKIQSVQLICTVMDAAAGVTPTLLQVDAGALEIVGAF